MALPATLVWEVRPTNGTANAGGGFDPNVASPGTDRSQQDAVQTAFTDLVIDAVTNTDVTSAASPFGAADVGNNIAITGGTGFTVGIYNVRSVTGVIARLDRAVGTTGSTGGTGNLGGARGGSGTPFSGGTTTLQASLVAGNIVYVKNEAWNEAVTLSVSGASGTPIRVIGYNTSRSDPAPTGTNRPQNNRASAAGVGINVTATTANSVWLENLRVTAAGSHGIQSSGAALLINCRSYSNGGAGLSCANAGATCINSELDSNTAHGFNNPAVNVACFFYGCYIHDNGNVGLNVLGGVQGVFVFNIVDTNTGHGIAHGNGGPFIAIGNTLYGNAGAAADGFNNSGTPTPSQFFNNISASNGRYGVNCVTDGDSVWANYNGYHGNATAARNNVPVGASDSTADPTFTNAGAGDFSIGTNLKALGFPGAFPGGTSTGYMDIGAVQRQEAAAGGGMLVHPGMAGGMRG